jgi:hypothetical protein
MGGALFCREITAVFRPTLRQWSITWGPTREWPPCRVARSIRARDRAAGCPLDPRIELACAYTSPAGRGPQGTSHGWRGDGEGPVGTGRGMEGLRWGPAASASRPGPGFTGRPERRTPESNTRAVSPESAAAYPKPQAGAASVHSRPTVTLETRSPTPSTSPMRPNPRRGSPRAGARARGCPGRFDERRRPPDGHEQQREQRDGGRREREGKQARANSVQRDPGDEHEPATDGVGDLRGRCGRAGLDLLCFSLLR